MKYLSTRNKSLQLGGAQVIAQGISTDGGLFVPSILPQLEQVRLLHLTSLSYVDRARNVLADFLDEFSDEEISRCVSAAYGGNRFDNEKVAPVVPLTDTVGILELWHGPTCAFKDMALQLLPHLLNESLKKVGVGREAVILVATSGDTGKAALEGFRDVKNARIIVYYPHGGVSNIQHLQMATQEGGNVAVCAVRGNFDDTQTAVKKIFTDPFMAEELRARDIMFSSANSINWGRLAPQIIYYISAYCDMVKSGKIMAGHRINVCVPTGNFGNILAAYYAKEMGLPIGKLICASNINNVLTDFIHTGVYDRRRDFVLTSSPSMDILISSNLERLIYELCDKDDEMVASLMAQLAERGVYEIPDNAKEQLQYDFYGGFCDEGETGKTIRETFDRYHYLCDTHTAVAIGVYNKYLSETGDDTKTLIVSTANPYKFSDSILGVFGIEKSENDFENLRALSRHTGSPVPPQLLALENKPIRFDDVCSREEMPEIVRRYLNMK